MLWIALSLGRPHNQVIIGKLNQAILNMFVGVMW